MTGNPRVPNSNWAKRVEVKSAINESIATARATIGARGEDVSTAAAGEKKKKRTNCFRSSERH
eukprot:8976242-Karenia_brevis.AAC.1